ncbi:MAG: hypothetical protein ABIC95_05995 [archaeon]
MTREFYVSYWHFLEALRIADGPMSITQIEDVLPISRLEGYKALERLRLKNLVVKAKGARPVRYALSKNAWKVLRTHKLHSFLLGNPLTGRARTKARNRKKIFKELIDNL